MKNKIIAYLRVTILLLPFLLSQSLHAQNSTGTFICFSDLHFNPFHNPALLDTLIKSPYEKWDDIFTNLDKSEPGKYGEDSDYSLFASLMNELVSADSNPDFIIYGGDFLSHHFLEEYRSLSGDTAQISSNAFILKTFEFIASKILARFPNCPVYFTLGNNDSYTGDYNSVWNGQFFKQTAPVFFNAFIKDESDRAGFISDYSTSGFYSVSLVHDGSWMELISLNTNFLSAKCPHDESAYGKNVLKWLTGKLEKAKAGNKKVWLINHIPPGVDVYNTLEYQENGKPIKHAKLFLNSKYNDTLLSIIKKYKDVITACFSGHIHTDDFRLYKNDQNDADTAYAFTHIIPSVSPVFANNPSFQIFSYDSKSFALLDYKTYSIDFTQEPARWKLEYDFNNAYNKNGINTESLNELHAEIKNNAAVRNNYVLYYTGSSKLASIADDWIGYWCGTANFTEENFVNAYNKFMQSK